MGKQDARVDAYINRSVDFARPILSHLRQLVHEACPEVEETMKWSFPHFDYMGGMCSMASFKNHCAFTFWKRVLLSDPHGILESGDERSAMGHLGQIRSLADLPPDAFLLEYIAEAARLNREKIPLPAKEKSAAPKELTVPEEIIRALETDPRAKETFGKFSNSHKKEYIEWITEAKTQATRDKRLATMLEWLAEGKSRNWKYGNK